VLILPPARPEEALNGLGGELTQIGIVGINWGLGWQGRHCNINQFPMPATIR